MLPTNHNALGMANRHLLNGSGLFAMVIDLAKHIWVGICRGVMEVLRVHGMRCKVKLGNAACCELVANKELDGGREPDGKHGLGRVWKLWHLTPGDGIDVTRPLLRKRISK